MSRDIPFFEMFTELQLSGELRLRLAGAVVNGACIDQATMSLLLRLTTKADLGEAELEELKRLLMGVYGFRQVAVELTVKVPAPAGAPVGSRPAAAPASGGKGGDRPAPGKVLMGKPIRTDPVPMRTLDLRWGTPPWRERSSPSSAGRPRRPGMWRLSFDMTGITPTPSPSRKT